MAGWDYIEEKQTELVDQDKNYRDNNIKRDQGSKKPCNFKENRIDRDLGTRLEGKELQGKIEQVGD